VDQVGADSLGQVDAQAGEEFGLGLVRGAHAAKAQLAAIYQR